ncbi:FAD-dependent oxidoreductase [Gorillibacterium sp. sgz5001074]|uniref:FAD-dependent oxidoreductase n=1 Tax=Gorillibacterium sp. sgz5001074 TaxID=3446695 RepID=UPI003F67D8FA
MLRKGLILTAVCVFSIMMTSSVRNTNYEIVIYGGGPQAVSTALMAIAAGGKDTDVLMIVPENQLGSIMTAGKQNLFDVNYYKSSKLPPGLPAGYEGSQGGSMFRFHRDLGAVFPPDRMAEYFAGLLKASGQVDVLYETDLTAVETAEAPDKKDTRSIRSVTYQRIKKDKDGRYAFKGKDMPPVKADIFVDASESGRLLRLTGADYHTGREDTGQDQLQMVATLMYKVKGVDAYRAIEPDKLAYGVAYSKKGSFQFWAGREAYTTPEVVRYNQENPYFRLKAYNAGEDGYSHVGSDTTKIPFWMNQQIIYEVDARKTYRDLAMNNGLYPDSKGLDPEEAREMALKELKNPLYWEMLRKLPGLEKVEPVLDERGDPVVGDMLYLRESIHARNRPEDPRKHALTKQDVMNGGEGLYDRRIGIGYYNFDSNTYKKHENLTNPLHEPWYVPYETIRTPEVDNLLLPGYAANIDSYSWSAMRVYPNLIMLGDAAGAAAGLALQHKFNLESPEAAQLRRLQETLYEHQAILEK